MIQPLANQSIEVVVLPQRVTPVPRVARERKEDASEDRPAFAPRRDTASFSAEALKKLSAERGDCSKR